ncbi:hypothetical protein DYB37_005874 [Aphanomyces astaci]|uniref:non-specific serine/threonine protein kinase n=1 Tax=Aphanomyces astaci TaxID=112090 RepID=A0A3R6YVT7_APHAT|nr:hypothetical protein DYB35_012332 [Aphanomyces astaci]RHZ25784.1 hypothetical protein DYB37_005874 [Aphanomyces astaci]
MVAHLLEYEARGGTFRATLVIMDKYKKLERIGKGSFGSAYLAEKRGEPGKQYVIKEIQIDPRDQKAAVREARLLAALDHPNIISCKEHFMLAPGQKVLCIVTEYADGGDLRKLLKTYHETGRRLSEDLVLDLLVQTCLALKHIHDRKILHRDVKPENIFLMQSNVVKLGDFGVAKVLSNTLACADTQTGTPYYTSPEICHGLRYNHKTDVNQKQLFHNIAYGAFDTTRLDHCTMRLKQLVIAMLAKTPRDRPSINGILKTPLVRDRIQTFLSAQEMQDELGHTVLHGQHLFRKPPSKAATSPRAMKHPPPPPIAIVRPIVVRERQPPVVRGYAAPTAAMKQRGDAMAAKKERVQALVAKQRELAEMRLVQEKKARLARKQAEVDRRKERSPPKAKRRQMLEQQAVRDLPVVPLKEGRERRVDDRDAGRLKMAEDIKEKKKFLKDIQPSDNDPIILVQALKRRNDDEDASATSQLPPAPELAHTMVPKVEAIFAPDTINFNSTGFFQELSFAQCLKEAAAPVQSPAVEPPPPAAVIDTDVITDAGRDVPLAKRSLEYERMLLQMKSVMEDNLAEEPDDDEEEGGDDIAADPTASGDDTRLSKLVVLQLPAFQAALKARWSSSHPLQPEETREAAGTSLLSAGHMEDVTWLCAYMHAIVHGGAAADGV